MPGTIQRQITEIKDINKSGIGQSLWGESTLKTESSNRILPVPKNVMEAVKCRERLVKINRLKHGAAYRNNDYVCCDEYGEFRKPSTFYKQFKCLLKELNLPSIRLHELRHSFATLMIEEHVTLKAVSHLLGHSNISTTADIYAGIINSHKEAANVIERCFFSSDNEEYHSVP